MDQIHRIRILIRGLKNNLPLLNVQDRQETQEQIRLFQQEIVDLRKEKSNKTVK
jgi:hypothetical protein